eukprot:scaffold19937_cov127-Isochrysis_galbana.AAC.10
MGDPCATPRSVLRATCMRCSGCRARFAMIDLFYNNNGSITTCPTSTRSRSWSFKMEMLTFVGTPDVYGLSTPTAIIHSCPMCFNPGFPNPQIFPARSIAEASAQFQVRDPSVEREGPITPLYGTYDCGQNPQSTPLNQPIVMPVHPSHIPLAPMYPPDFDFPCSVIDTPTP